MLGCLTAEKNNIGKGEIFHILCHEVTVLREIIHIWRQSKNKEILTPFPLARRKTIDFNQNTKEMRNWQNALSPSKMYKSGIILNSQRTPTEISKTGYIGKVRGSVE